MSHGLPSTTDNAECSTSVSDKSEKGYNLCRVHVILTERRMSKLVFNVKYLLLLFFLTVSEFYNLGHIQGITGCINLKEIIFSGFYYFQF